MQFRLFAFYNQKDKAIGLVDADLTQSLSLPNHGRDHLQSIVFQKCFDKNATLTYEVRVREASQKGSGGSGSLTARVSSNTSTLVPISEEETSSINEMVADDQEEELKTPNSI